MFVKVTRFRVRRAALCGGAYGGRAASRRGFVAHRAATSFGAWEPQ